MQELREILEDETLANSLAPMNRNWQSLKSQNSGTSFPAVNVVKGQACFREDDLCLYVCADPHKALWVKIASLTLTYVNKEYVDSIHIPLSRVDNLIDTATNKIKMTLINSGTTTGKVVVVGANNHIATSLIDTGTTAGKVLQVGGDGKIPVSVLNVGVHQGEIPIIADGDRLPNSLMPTNVAVFDSQGRLKFPNGALLWVG